MLANPQRVYRRSLRFRWSGTYHWVLSEIACSIKGDVKNIFLPPPGAAVLICDIQPLSPRRRSGVVALNDCISAAGIFFSSDDADQFRNKSSRVVVRWQPWIYLRLVA